MFRVDKSFHLFIINNVCNLHPFLIISTQVPFAHISLVHINGAESNLAYITCGVSQRSILGPRAYGKGGSVGTSGPVPEFQEEAFESLKGP